MTRSIDQWSSGLKILSHLKPQLCYLKDYIVMSPKILSGTTLREIKMNKGVCEIYLALEVMRHNSTIYVYCMCSDETKEVWQVSNVSRSLSLDKQKSISGDLMLTTELITSLNITPEKDWKTDNLNTSSTFNLIEWVGTLGVVYTLFS